MELFSRVVVGVDDSPEAREAVRQAAILAAPDGVLRVVTVKDYATAMQAGAVLDEIAEEIETAAKAALDAARAEAPTAETEALEGEPVATLLADAERAGATCIAVGAHKRSRAVGIVVRSMMTNVVHKAHTSVLVARAAGPDGTFPRTVIVGVDGSAHSQAAYAAAKELADRLGAPFRAIAASAGETLDEDALSRIPELERIEESPVAALEDLAVPGDLIVVGCRGLHGVAALGSVSERLAHGAPASVLVVRDGG
jgi:nucleotide-binding universal stress UspA family protein